MSSVIDSRTSPNHFRLLNGTQIYDVGPDSRVAPALTPSYVITSVAAAIGNNTAYTGTFTVLAIPVGSLMEISGFVTAANNGVFQVVSVTATTLTLLNPSGAAETHAATATTYFPSDSRVSGPVVDSRLAANIPVDSRV